MPLDVKAGDRVLLGKYSGSEIKMDGEEYLIVREDEVLGIVENANPAKASQRRRDKENIIAAKQIV